MSKNIPAIVLLGHFQNDNVKDKTYDDGTNGIKQMLLSHLLEVEKLHKEKEENEIYGDLEGK